MFICILANYVRFDVDQITYNQPQRDHLDNIPSVEVCYSLDEAVLSEPPLQKAWDSFPTPQEVLDMEKTQINGYTNGNFGVTKLIRDNLMCFDISLAGHSISRKNLTGIPIMARIVLKPDLNKNKDPMMYVYVHARDTGASTRSAGFIQSPRGSSVGSWLTFTYSRSTYQLLSSPYITNCKQYQGFMSQDDCFNRCLINSKDNASNALPFETVVDDESILTFGRQTKNGTQGGQDCQHCLKQCHQQDCVKEIITPRLISSTPADQDQIDIIYPTEPEMVVTSVPVYTCFSFLKDTVYSICVCLLLSPIPMLLFERRVAISVAETLFDIKHKRNGVIPEDTVCGSGAGINSLSGGHRVANGINIVNAFANNNMNGH